MSEQAVKAAVDLPPLPEPETLGWARDRHGNDERIDGYNAERVQEIQREAFDQGRASISPVAADSRRIPVERGEAVNLARNVIDLNTQITRKGELLLADAVIRMDAALSATSTPPVEPTDSDIMEAVARGWCAPINANKEMDSDLAFAITGAVRVLLSKAATVEPTSQDDARDALSVRKAVLDVELERVRQDGKWGGADHDDEHSTAEFVLLIEDYAGWARTMAGMNSPDKARNRLVQVAALAVAAVESIDRAAMAAQAAQASEVKP